MKSKKIGDIEKFCDHALMLGLPVQDLLEALLDRVIEDKQMSEGDKAQALKEIAMSEFQISGGSSPLSVLNRTLMIFCE